MENTAKRAESIYALLSEKKEQEIMLSGYLKTMDDQITKNGKPYISGEFVKGEEHISYKMWDYTRASFYEKYGLGDASARVVDTVCELQFYEGSASLIIKKVKPLPDTELPKFSFHTPYNIDEMLAKVDEEIKKIGDEQVKNACAGAIGAVRDKLRFYPLSVDGPHPEIGGFLTHIYRVLVMVEHWVGLSPESYYDNGGVVRASVVLHHLFALQSMRCTPNGEVIDDGEKGSRMFGSFEQGSLLLAWNAFTRGGAKVNSYAMRVIHSLATLCGAEPETLDAFLFHNLCILEAKEDVKKRESKANPLF